MKDIKTPSKFVSPKQSKTIKREAKKHAKEHGVKHTKALMILSKTEEFDHWHHFQLCEKQTREVTENTIILRFTGSLEPSMQEFLKQNAFVEVSKDSKVTVFLDTYKDFVVKETEYVFETDFEEYVFIGKGFDELRTVDELINHLYMNFESWPEDLLFYGQYTDFWGAVDDGEIHFDMDIYAGMWD